MDDDERIAYIDRLALRTSLPVDFFIFSLISGIVLALGLTLDSVTLIFLGSVLAPAMLPIVGLGLGTVTGSIRFFFRSLIGFLIGAGFVFGSGLVIGNLSRGWQAESLWQAHNHALVSWVNLLIVIFAAGMLALNTTHKERNTALPSVLLAYTIYSPLATAGIGLTGNVPHLWPDSLVVFSFYLALAILAGSAVLVLMGFRPLTWLGYTIGATMGLFGLAVLVVIGGASAFYGANIARPTPTPTLTPTFTPVPPSATVTLTPVPPTLTPTPTITFTPTPTVTPTFTPSPTPVYARINADKDAGGAWLRDAPGFDGSVVKVYLNGTLVIVLPDSTEVNNKIWSHVIVVDDGNEGWILETLISVATPRPDW